MANLNRFLQAQDDFNTYRQALQEMKAGRKTSHWVWFIFPQLKGLGRSYNSNYYGIESLKEAEDYLTDPVLEKRLREITSAVLSHRGDDIEVIMGGRIDAMKFRSSMTLFDAVCPGDIFSEALEEFFHGMRDSRTAGRLINTLDGNGSCSPFFKK